MIEDNNNTIVVKDEPPAPATCIKCSRTFKSEKALRMHKIRMHSSKGWDTSKNFQGKHSGKVKTREARLETRRAYQRRLRERYYSEGRNSKGEKMPAGWKPNPNRQKAAFKRRAEAAMKRIATRVLDRIEAREDARKGIPLSRTPEYVRRYQKRYLAKRAARNNQEMLASAQITSTTPDIAGEAARAILVAASVLRAVTVGMKITQ